MTRIYDDAKDKNVAKIVVYVGEDGAIFYDAEATEAVPAADCLDLFVKGVVALKDGVYYAAKSCTTEGVIDFGISTSTF